MTNQILKKNYIEISYGDPKLQKRTAKITIDSLKKLGFTDQELETAKEGTLESSILQKIQEIKNPSLKKTPNDQKNPQSSLPQILPKLNQPKQLERPTTGLKKREIAIPTNIYTPQNALYTVTEEDEKKEVEELSDQLLTQFEEHLSLKGLNKEQVQHISSIAQRIFANYQPVKEQQQTLNTIKGTIYLNHNYKILGRGSYGLVKQVYNQAMDPLVLKIAEVIAKKHKDPIKATYHSIRDLLNEFIVLKRIHKLGLIDGIQKPHLQVVLLNSGQVGILIQSYKGSLVAGESGELTFYKDLEPGEFIENFDRLVGALKYMSNHNIFSPDIKPSNILWDSKIDKSGKTKVVWDFADHGGTRFMDDEAYLKESPIGTITEKFSLEIDRAAAHEAYENLKKQKPGTRGYTKALELYQEIQKKRMVSTFRLTMLEIYYGIDEKFIPKDEFMKIQARMDLLEKEGKKEPLCPMCLSIDELYAELEALKRKESK